MHASRVSLTLLSTRITASLGSLRCAKPKHALCDCQQPFTKIFLHQCITTFRDDRAAASSRVSSRHRCMRRARTTRALSHARREQNQGLQKITHARAPTAHENFPRCATLRVHVIAATEHFHHARANDASRRVLSCIAQVDLRESAQAFCVSMHAMRRRMTSSRARDAR